MSGGYHSFILVNYNLVGWEKKVFIKWPLVLTPKRYGTFVTIGTSPTRNKSNLGPSSRVHYELMTYTILMPFIKFPTPVYTYFNGPWTCGLLCLITILGNPTLPWDYAPWPWLLQLIKMSSLFVFSWLMWHYPSTKEYFGYLDTCQHMTLCQIPIWYNINRSYSTMLKMIIYCVRRD